MNHDSNLYWERYPYLVSDCALNRIVCDGRYLWETKKARELTTFFFHCFEFDKIFNFYPLQGKGAPGFEFDKMSLHYFFFLIEMSLHYLFQFNFPTMHWSNSIPRTGELYIPFLLIFKFQKIVESHYTNVLAKLHI